MGKLINKPLSNSKKAVQSNILSGKYLHYLILSGIILLTLIIYWGTLKNGFLNWDDTAIILKNKDIQNFTFPGIVKIFFSFYIDTGYKPLTVLTWSIIYKFFGFDPIAFHSVNMFFHLLNIILVYIFIYNLNSSQSSGFRIQVSAIIACLFAIHPMHTESVSWLSALCDPQYSFYYLASLIFYLKYIQRPTVLSPQSSFIMQHSAFFLNKNYLISLLLFIFSLLSKPMAVTLPAILILLDYYSGRKFNNKSIIDKIPFFLLALAAGIITIFSEKITDIITANDLIHNSIFNKFFIFSYSVSFYIINLIAPFKLSALHPSPEIIDGFLPIKYYLSAILIIIITGIIYKTRKTGKEVIFGTLFFFFTISVTLIPGKIRFAEVAERYTYIPYLGLFFIITILYKLKPKSQKLIVLIAVFIILCFSVISYNRNKIWSNALSLFNDVVEKYPGSSIAYNYRGIAKSDIGDKNGAIEDFNRAIELNPQFAFAINNRGLAEYALGNKHGAIEDYKKAIEIYPKLAKASYNIDLAKAYHDYNQEYINDYNKAIEINPDDVLALLNRGHKKASLGDLQGAIKDFNSAIEINPKSAEAYNNRGNAKASINDMKGAIEDYDKVLEINPQHVFALMNRGHAKYILGDKDGACSDWRKAGELGKMEAFEIIKKYCK
jgi:protein O-mannosyl-transferase